MKKIFFLFLLSITILVQKNYSQPLVQNKHEQMKAKGINGNKVTLKERRCFTNYDKLDTSNTCINRRDSIFSGVNVELTPVGFTFNAVPVFPTLEDIYKRWEQAFKGTSFY